MRSIGPIGWGFMKVLEGMWVSFLVILRFVLGDGSKDYSFGIMYGAGIKPSR
jgi:hypothetical protein